MAKAAAVSLQPPSLFKQYTHWTERRRPIEIPADLPRAGGDDPLQRGPQTSRKVEDAKVASSSQERHPDGETG